MVHESCTRGGGKYGGVGITELEEEDAEEEDGSINEWEGSIKLSSEVMEVIICIYLLIVCLAITCM